MANKPLIAFAVTPEEKKQLEAIASKMGMTVSGYIRYKLLYEKEVE